MPTQSLWNRTTGPCEGLPFFEFGIKLGSGRNATFIVEGGRYDGTRQLWIGRMDATDLTIKQWPMWPSPGVDHDAEGNPYAVWIDGGDAQYFVRGMMEPMPG